jgi:hypothetical protein
MKNRILTLTNITPERDKTQRICCGGFGRRDLGGVCMTPIETLKAARQLITDPAKWTQGDFARDAKGYGVFSEDRDAVCFCALGAIYSFNSNGPVPCLDAYTALREFCFRKFSCEVSDFNDTHTHAEVLALFDAAIAELEGV